MPSAQSIHFSVIDAVFMFERTRIRKLKPLVHERHFGVGAYSMTQVEVSGLRLHLTNVPDAGAFQLLLSLVSALERGGAKWLSSGLTGPFAVSFRATLALTPALWTRVYRYFAKCAVACTGVVRADC